MNIRLLLPLLLTACGAASLPPSQLPERRIVLPMGVLLLEDHFTIPGVGDVSTYSPTLVEASLPDPPVTQQTHYKIGRHEVPVPEGARIHYTVDLVKGVSAEVQR